MKSPCIHTNINGSMNGRRGMGRKHFITVENQLMKVEGMMKLENHYLTTITITDLGKNHQRMLKLLRGNLRSN